MVVAKPAAAFHRRRTILAVEQFVTAGIASPQKPLQHWLFRRCVPLQYAPKGSQVCAAVGRGANARAAMVRITKTAKFLTVLRSASCPSFWFSVCYRRSSLCAIQGLGRRFCGRSDDLKLLAGREHTDPRVQDCPAPATNIKVGVPGIVGFSRALPQAHEPSVPPTWQPLSPYRWGRERPPEWRETLLAVAGR